ncbi:CDP-paratose synthase [Citrifermentans bemidjiense Bem]|uniref:CDP-paratose synthase n=1 Tax=Citrifermentans bemidjiense (strain ATCC BAA-1014 / DSM 16622 / JCM 12645 / Bem) TaxID=404380 RepID=B5EEY5_CITBB|nr:NAD(P)-dependent oxidoreductase [Citrifermentans bemidjiense]ACH37881.1 CDP-paratose synthase [Citrifermentans bemidjiense Bem]
MKILVTGATGFLGSRLVEALLRQGHQVIVLKRSFSDTRRLKGMLSSIALYDLDRSPLADPFREHGTLDAVLHAATCYGRRGESSSEICEANVAFPLRLLEAACSHGTARFINTDTSLYRGINAYALSKKQFSEWGKLAAESGRIRFVNVVLEHFYGPGDDDGKFVSHVIKSCRQGVPELKLTKGEQERDFIYIDDVVSAYLLLLQETGCSEPACADYPLGSGQTVSLRALVEMIGRLTGSTTKLNFGALPYRQNEAMHSVADIVALERLGWKATVDLSAGLARTVAYQQQEDKNGSEAEGSMS